jgi:hypothetical protein
MSTNCWSNSPPWVHTIKCTGLQRSWSPINPTTWRGLSRSLCVRRATHLRPLVSPWPLNGQSRWTRGCHCGADRWGLLAPSYQWPRNMTNLSVRTLPRRPDGIWKLMLAPGAPTWTMRRRRGLSNWVMKEYNFPLPVELIIIWMYGKLERRLI